MTTNPQLAALDLEFFHVQNTIDPLSATQLGIAGYDADVPDLSLEGARRGADQLRAIEEALTRIDPTDLNDDDLDDLAILARLAEGQRVELEDGVWAMNASAESYSSPPAMVFMCVPAVAVTPASEESYLTRLSQLGPLFESMALRYHDASASGHQSTRAGLDRSISQLRAHLTTDITGDLLANPATSPAVSDSFIHQCRQVVDTLVRPGLIRLLDQLESMRDLARPDDMVGLRFLDGGDELYARAVRRHTTTMLTPHEIHAIGLERVARVREELSSLADREYGDGNVDALFERLRHDPALRFSTSQEIETVAQSALERAEAARTNWFEDLKMADCVIEPVHPIEARNAALGHYRPPASDGSRPGAYCLLTTDPTSRFRYEYEALSFHESSPGHHLQIASAQLLDLPQYRRHLDTQVGAFVEGWGLYAERLADEMGLYSSPLDRIGMLSFEGLRACRLVVDTGMHYLGWSRQRAIDFMWSNTATTATNVANEIDRYIGWPGQALSYLMGRLTIERLRAVAQANLDSDFDVREFHGVVIGAGAVPLDVLETRVLRWMNERLESS